MAICLIANREGQGGIAGGAGNIGQTSQHASGAYATGYGFPVIDITTGMTATLQVQLTTDIGGQVPADLSQITDIRFVARPSMRTQRNYIEVQCQQVHDVSGASTGVIKFTLTPAQVNNHQGIHYAQVLCYKDQMLVHDFRCYLQIRRGMTGAPLYGTHPVTIAEVRMALMDTSAQANRLLDDLQFSDVMIAQCIQRAVDQWNETPPTLRQMYTVATFPYRQALIQGAVGFLLSMVLHRYARNRMQHSNAGLSLDDSDKQHTYLQLSNLARQQWKAFVAAKKTQHNMRQCFTIMNQPWFDSWCQELY